MISKRTVKISSIIIINIILGILITRWLWLHVDFNLIINESMSLNRTSVILSVLLGMSLYLIYGWRMSLLLDINLMASTQIIILGFGLNAFLPIRLGDVLKVIIAKQFYKIDLTKTSFATVIEKGLDLAVIGFFALIFIFGSTKLYTALLLFSLASVVLYSSQKNGFNFKLNNQLATKIISMAQLMLSRKKHKSVIFCTLSIWFITCFVFYLFFSMNIISGIKFTIIDAITLIIFTTLSLALPSMPASIGIFESGIVLYLTYHFHFSAEKAVAYAIIFHLIMILPQILFTVIILLTQALNMGKLEVISNDV